MATSVQTYAEVIEEEPASSASEESLRFSSTRGTTARTAKRGARAEVQAPTAMQAVQSLRGLVYKVGAATCIAFLMATIALSMDSSDEAPVALLFSAAASAAGLNVLYSNNATVATAVDTPGDLLNAVQAMYV